MSTSLIQQTPAVRELIRAQLLAVIQNEDYSRALEQCVWDYSNGVVPSPTRYTKSVKKGKKSAVTAVATSLEDAGSLPDSHLLYEGKILQLLHNLRVNGTALLEKYAPHEMVWLDDAALAVGTMAEHLAYEATEHVQRLQKILEDSTHHTSVIPDVIPESSTTFLRCRKCKSTNVNFNQKQTRAGDEGMTSFCTCKSCGATWKM
jgi:DNA-directed RNA polymerase subunit M/transcription elongation factor TFIIS